MSVVEERGQRRRSLRWRGHDHSACGSYFVTICTQDRACLFGEIHAGEPRLAEPGSMITRVWEETSARFPTVATEELVVMPNHVHALLVLTRASDPTDAASGWSRASGIAGPPAPQLGDFVGTFRSLSTAPYIHGIRAGGWPRFHGRLWQRSYFEHVVRTSESRAHHGLHSHEPGALDRRRAPPQPPPTATAVVRVVVDMRAVEPGR